MVPDSMRSTNSFSTWAARGPVTRYPRSRVRDFLRGKWQAMSDEEVEENTNTRAHHALYPTRDVTETLVASESTQAAIPAGNRSYMTPVVNIVALWECRTTLELQLRAVAITPSAAGPHWSE